MGFVKDLSKIGRDLTKVVMIDNIVENFRLQSNNGLWTSTWTEDMKDTQLQDLCRILADIYNLKPSDVRPYVKKIKDEVNAKLNKNIQNPYSKIDVK
jgi:TFIIF-interacting CTD phosphatase-like protein